MWKSRFKRVTQVLGLISATAVLTGCIPQNAPEVKIAKFTGKPVSFPVKFLGAGVLDKKIGKSDLFINKSVHCSYTFGSQKGRFTTPAVISFKHTDQLKTLTLDCNTKFIDSPWFVEKTFSGRTRNSVNTTFSNLKNQKQLLNTQGQVYAGGYRVKINNEHQLALSRQSIINDKGVQLLPFAIIVDPFVKVVSAK